MATNFIATNKNYKRLFAAALDNSSEYETYEEMLAYIPNPISYKGQILYCAETDSLYRIASNADGEKILKNDIINDEDAILKPEQVLTVLYTYGEEFKGSLGEALDYLFTEILKDIELTPEMVLQLSYKYESNEEVNTIEEALNYLMKAVNIKPGITAEEVLYISYNYKDILEGDSTLGQALNYLMEKSIEELKLTPDQVLNILYTNNDCPDVNSLRGALDFIIDKIIKCGGLKCDLKK